MCGNRRKVAEWTSGWKMLNSTNVMLKFVTDYSVAHKGFRFEWKKTPIVLKHSTNQCTLTSMINQFNYHIAEARNQELLQSTNFWDPN